MYEVIEPEPIIVLEPVAAHSTARPRLSVPAPREAPAPLAADTEPALPAGPDPRRLPGHSPIHTFHLHRPLQARAR